MFFQRIKTPGIAHNAYLLGSQGVGVVVDPRRDIDEYLALARKNKLKIEYVLETHRQEDFVLGSAELRRQTGARVVSGRHPLSAHTDLALADGESFEAGGLRFQCLYTPGHTPESVSYAVYMKERPDRAWAVFTGDALFIGEAGRTDLPDPDKTAENAALLYDSIQKKILPLGDQTLLYPAHGAGSVCGGNIAAYDESTLGFERRYNPAFVSAKDEFVKLKLEERIPRPPYFRLMEKLNLKGGAALARGHEQIPVLPPADFARESAGEVVIDARLPEAFAGGHVPGAFSIWLEGLPVFGGWVADEKAKVYLIVERADDVKTAFLSLARIGVDVAGVLAGGFEAWRDAGLPIERSGTVEARDKALADGTCAVVDVREITEFEEGHIRGARHAYVGYLADLPLEETLDAKAPVAVVCSVGHRASLAASILLRAGFKKVVNVLGGMTAWKKLDLPLAPGSDEKRTLDLAMVERRDAGRPAYRAQAKGG